MSDSEFVRNYPFHIPARVEWADLDAFQHVNNTIYFRYFERVRIEYFSHTGFMESLREDGIGPILASTQCRFRAPLNYPDRLHIGTGIRDLQEDRFLMQYAVYSESLARVAAEGDGLIVCYDYRRACKTGIPDRIRHRLRSVAYIQEDAR